MQPIGGLEGRLRALVDRSAERRAEERLGMQRRMEDLEPRRARFERVVRCWMTDLVLPRLEALVRTLGSGTVEHPAGWLTARARFPWRPEVPVGASLTVSVSSKDEYRQATVHIEPQLIPMLSGNPPERSYACDIEQDPESLARFVEDEVVVFADAYLAAGEPTSPYQRGGVVVDPVCGMSLHAAAAVESIEHEGRRYYFCATSCAHRFRDAPELHTAVRGRPGSDEGVES